MNKTNLALPIAYANSPFERPQAPTIATGTTYGSMLDHALWWAGMGFRVLPVYGVIGGICDCRKSPCGENNRNAGKHPRISNWQHQATTDPAVITGWWTEWPTANIAVATGAGSNVDVLDYDAGKGGIESLESLEREHGLLPLTPEEFSGGGGGHIFFRHHPDVRSRAGILPGLDVRGEGGYIIVAPSMHLSGRRYELDPERMVGSGLADWPAWLLDIIKGSTSKRAAPASSPIGVVGRVPAGRRNSTLTSHAGWLRRQGHTPDEIFAALIVENQRCQPPLTDEEVRKIADSVGRYSPAEPLLLLPCTDVGNANRLVLLHGEDLRHTKGWGWLCWDGRRWVREAEDVVMEFAKDTIQQFAVAAESEPDADKRKRLLTWAQQSEAGPRLREMINLAKSDPAVRASVEEFDANPWLLNLSNGTLDLQKWVCTPHRREDRITKLADIEYAPHAVCPQWDRFMSTIMGNNPALVEYIQRAVGYSLSGITKEHVLFLLLGLGRNGKSTFLEINRALLGDYAQTADFTTFLTKQNDSIRNDLARLCGARFVSASEVAAGRRLDEAVVKQVTGGDYITARFLHKEFFEFPPTFKLWLAANHAPVIHGTDMGIWRRIRRIPFTVTIPDSDVDKNLGEKLRGELPGILMWAIRGFAAYVQAGGLAEPPEVAEATKEYQQDMDALAPFIEECCIVGPTMKAATEDLYTAYTTWCSRTGEKPITMMLFGVRLGERGFNKIKMQHGGKRGRAGIGLKTAQTGAMLPFSHRSAVS